MMQNILSWQSNKFIYFYINIFWSNYFLPWLHCGGCNEPIYSIWVHIFLSAFPHLVYSSKIFSQIVFPGKKSSLWLPSPMRLYRILCSPAEVVHSIVCIHKDSKSKASLHLKQEVWVLCHWHDQLRYCAFCQFNLLEALIVKCSSILQAYWMHIPQESSAGNGSNQSYHVIYYFSRVWLVHVFLSPNKQNPSMRTFS